MLATLYAITATDAVGNDWIAVKEGNFTDTRSCAPPYAYGPRSLQTMAAYAGRVCISLLC